jgi:hypothetical protein
MAIKDKAMWVIKLPAKAKILVEIGDKVKENDKLAVFSSHKVETFDFSGPLSKISEDKRQELNNFFEEKHVEAGDLILNLGIFKNKICFPMAGLCLGFDEFKNLRIEKREDNKKEILAPVEAKVNKIEEGRMVLEFNAKEYKAEGLNGLKAWGSGEIKVIDDMKLLSYKMENNVLFTKNLNKAFLLKAQVVGVKGLVVLGNEEIKEININLPVIRLEEEVWKEFMKENLGKDRKILINAKTDKLLLVF